MMDMRKDIFNLMKSYGFSMKMYDSEGNGPLMSPTDAEYIYCVKGNLTYMFVIEDDSTRFYKHIVLYKSTDENPDEFRKLLKSIKVVTTKNTFSITIKNFGRKFTPKDFAYIPKMNKKPLEEAFNVKGTKKTSYHANEQAKVVVRHKKEIMDDVDHARSRNIKEVYVATKGGERRKINNGKLSVGKAVANYINNGGSLYDATTNQLILLGDDLEKLRSIKTNENYTVLEDDKKTKVSSLIAETRKQINKFMTSLCRKKTKLEESDLDFLSSPQYDFSKAYYESILGDSDLAESLARGSMFIERTGSFDDLDEFC
jgi:hypothetical protein